METTAREKTTPDVPAYSNILRLGVSEDAVVLQFGYLEKFKMDTENVDEDAIIESKRVIISPKMMSDVAFMILDAGIEYEKKYNKDIGFSMLYRGDSLEDKPTDSK